MTDLLAAPNTSYFSAHASVDAFLLVDAPTTEAWDVRGTHAVIQPYTVVAGRPMDITDTVVVARSGVAIGKSSGASYPERPDTLGFDVLSRWVGGTEDYAAGVWTPQEGDKSVTWKTPTGGEEPVPWDGYIYRMGTSNVIAPAIVFSGKEWMTLTTASPWTTAELTVAMVAVLRPGFGANYRILATPERSSDDPTRVASLTLNFEQGTLRGMLRDLSVAQSDVPYSGRPVGIVLRASTSQVSLSVLHSRTLSTTTSAIQQQSVAIDANIHLARGLSASDTTALAVAGVFDVAVWGRYLGDDEVRGVLDVYDSGYGLTR